MAFLVNTEPTDDMLCFQYLTNTTEKVIKYGELTSYQLLRDLKTIFFKRSLFETHTGALGD